MRTIIAVFAIAALSLTACGKSSSDKSNAEKPAAAASSSMQSPAAEPAKSADGENAYKHAVDCMAATMSGRETVEKVLKASGSSTSPFMVGPTWARAMHEAGVKAGHNDAQAETDGTTRLADANKAKFAGKPLFDEAFVTACTNDMPKY